MTYLNKDDYEKETVAVNESYFKTLKPGIGAEGIWINADSSITLGIKKFPGNEYKAIVLSARIVCSTGDLFILR